jgi:hypothetical protein
MAGWTRGTSLHFIHRTMNDTIIQSSYDKGFADSAQARTARPVFLARFWLARRAVYLSLIAVILGLYSYPALRTASTTGSRSLPAVSAPDLGLYLSLSNLRKDRDGSPLNPYYRISVPANSVGFLKFRLGPMLFGWVNELFASRMWPALFVWNLFWWGFLCLSAIWLFEHFLPQAPVELVLAGLSLLMLFNFGMLQNLITAWIHFPSMLFFQRVEFAYIRPFTPQIAIPLLFCYLGLQMLALQSKSMAAWGAMVVLQFIAFAAFPYATLMMAGTTAVSASWYIFSRVHDSAWRTVLGFFLVCSLADVAFLLHGSAGLRAGTPDQSSLIHLQLSLVSKSIGRLWLLTGVLVAATAISRKLLPEVQWPLVGLGLANMFFVLGDAVVPERTLFLSDHIGYFYHSTIVILLTFLVSAHIPSRGQASVVLRVASLAAVGFCFVNGLLLAEANYKRYLPHNLEQADMARWFGRGQVTANDLVITQFAVSQYDACEWVPFLSDGEVLYCRNAQCVLTPEQNREVQRLREVLYLYFEGKDHQWLESTTAVERYGFYGELTAFHSSKERADRIVAIRREMLPLFDRVEHGDPAIREFFRRFRQVWIVQNRQNPTFVDARLKSYLDIKEQEKAGELFITSATPK